MVVWGKSACVYQLEVFKGVMEILDGQLRPT